jgi:SAM-dependent methyltransferase
MNESVPSPTGPKPLPARSEFNEEAYVRLHPDVAVAIRDGVVGSGWQHYTLHGFRENRACVAKPDALRGVLQEIAPGDEMLRNNATHYFDVGESALHNILAVLATAGRPVAGTARILDLPCGHGRVMRFLRKAFPAAQLTACDLNRAGVAFCAEKFGAVPVVSQPDVAAIPLTGPFDLIWCGSLLTHLPREKWPEFLSLFQRLLGPGGIVVVTTHGPHCETELVTGKHRYGLEDAQIAALLAEYRRTGFGYVDYAGSPGYGISLARPSYVRANFVQPPGWQLLSYHEAAWDQRQDVVALQRV